MDGLKYAYDNSGNIEKTFENGALRLRSVMEERKITRYRVVKDTNIGDDYFTTWKQGSEPHVFSLIQLADYIGCTIDYLVGREK